MIVKLPAVAGVAEPEHVPEPLASATAPALPLIVHVCVSSVPGSVKLAFTGIGTPTGYVPEVGVLIVTVGFTFATVTWKVALPVPGPVPFSSATVMVTVYVPLSAYVCVCR